MQNAPFCPISSLGSNFNPRNTQCIPVVKIIALLELEQKLTFFKGLLKCQNVDIRGRDFYRPGFLKKEMGGSSFQGTAHLAKSDFYLGYRFVIGMVGMYL
ncbi:MAG: hypothetical protein KJO34_06190 [Deltaproteobacteria bacterium]|nr:hypothetical protein [Deltaproteobacteria bacterium]